MAEGIQINVDLVRPVFRLRADLALPGRGVTALFGPSGSGKTTLLRALAGLERVAGASIRVNGEIWQDATRFLPVHRRAIGMVFQEPSLFAHLSVLGNLEYGQKRIAASARRIELGQAVELLGIESLLTRQPDGLSGGERQRVAIARALLTSPGLLLLDEPLAALDAKRKAEILPYLEKLHDELDIPMIYVSHSPDEVARLADHLVLLDHGTVVASGSLSETLARLDLPGVFRDEAGVVIHATLLAHEPEDALSRLRFAGGDLYVNQRALPLGHVVRLRIAAQDISVTLAPQRDTSILNVIPATVVDFADTDHPARVLVQLDAGGVALLARITRRSLRMLDLRRGQPVWAQIKAVALLND